MARLSPFMTVGLILCLLQSVQKWSMHDFVLVRSGLVAITLIHGEDKNDDKFLKNASKMTRYNLAEPPGSAKTDPSSADNASGGDDDDSIPGIIGHLEAGQHLGQSLFFGISEVRNLNLIAQEVSEVLVFRADSFHGILSEKQTGGKEQKALLEAAATDLQSQRFFHSFTIQFLTEIVTHFDSVIYGPGEKILKSGTIGDELFILKEGSACVEVNGFKKMTLEPVCVFGEIVVLGLTRERSACVVAQTMCKVNALPGEKFRAALLSHPEALAIFEDLAADRLKTIAGESCRRCNLFINCSDEFIWKMDLYSERRVVFPGRPILKSSQSLDRLLIIQRGDVDVVRDAVFDDNGHFVSGNLVSVVPSGEVIGDLEILGGMNSETYSLVARGFVHLRELPAGEFCRVVDELHDDRKIITRLVVARLAEHFPYYNFTLSKQPLFAAFSDLFLKMLQNLVAGDILNKNENIVSEGEPLDSAVAILDGTAQIMCDDVVAGYLKPGQIFGEQSLFSDQGSQVWPYSVKTRGRCIVQRLDGQKFRDMMDVDGGQLRDKDDIIRMIDLKKIFERSTVANNFGRADDTAALVRLALANTPWIQLFSKEFLDELSQVAIERVVVEGQHADPFPGSIHDSKKPRTACNNALVMVLGGNVEFFELKRYITYSTRTSFIFSSQRCLYDRS